MIEILIHNAGVLAFFIFGFWVFACVIRDVSFIDAFWAMGMVVLSWESAFEIWPEQGESGIGTRGNVILFLVTIWGTRLGWHLLLRWRDQGEDPRYAKILASAIKDKGWNWPMAALFRVFLLQAPLLYITCLPAQLGVIAGGSMNALGWAGAAIALIGIAFETIGDAQLKAFRADPANQGKVLDTGLWRYTRHPNYFGDFLTWWGIWLVASGAGPAVALGSIIGPLFLSFTLIRWSGAPLLERGMKKSRPGYSEYIERTSGFFPMPPKNKA